MPKAPNLGLHALLERRRKKTLVYVYNDVDYFSIGVEHILGVLGF
jgi:hypothetical protein